MAQNLWSGIPATQAPDWGNSFLAGRERIFGEQRTARADQRDKISLIGQYAANADTPEKWAAAMEDLQRAGVPDARDYVNRFDLRNQLIERSYATPDQMNSRTAQGFLSSLPGAQQGANLSPGYLSSVNRPQPQGAAPPVQQTAMAGGAGTDMLKAGLKGSESGGNPGAVNGMGYSGLYQFGEGALQTAGLYGGDPTPGQREGMDWAGQFSIPGHPEVRTQADFLKSPQAQEAAFDVYKTDLERQMKAAGMERYIGQTVGGVPITPEGLVWMAHLGGVAGTRRFLETDGRYNPADENGTRLSDYGRRALGATAGAGSVRPATRDVQPPAPNGVPLESLQVLAGNPSFAQTAVAAGINQYAAPKDQTVWARLDDGRLFNQRTGEIVEAPGAAAIKPTDDMREYEFAKSQDPTIGTFNEWMLQNKKAGAAQLNVDMAGEKKYDQTMGEGLGKLNLEMAQGAQKARSSINTLQMMQAALSDPAVTQGAWGPSSLMLKRGAQALGMDVGNLGPAELAQAIGSELTLQARDPSQGAGMPGAMSDADRNFLSTIPPGLSKTPQGNAMVIDYLMRKNQRTLEIEKLRQDYVRQNGRMDENFFAQLSDWSDTHPLFTDADRQAMQAAQPQGLPQFDPNAATAPAQVAPQAGPPKIGSDAEYNALPSGTDFVAPDGTIRRKP